MKVIELSKICEYYRDKIDVAELLIDDYVSTENMLPNRGGIVEAASLPTTTTTQKFERGDVLVSNIRPYFKKIWYADKDGGCSNDVLVFRAKDRVDSMFLYYVLSADEFFAYSMGTSKGTKMPRGDKQAIMTYHVPALDLSEQKKIVEILRCIDEKIKHNENINKNLAA